VECGPENHGVECGWASVSAGFWGWRSLAGNGWGSDPNPGLRTIQEDERAWDTVLRRYSRWLEGAPWPWSSSFSSDPWLPDLQGLDLWSAGVDELKKRIEGQDACAKFFGGKDNALKVLAKLKPQVGNLPGSAIAAINGNKVTLDSTRFSNSGPPLQTFRLKAVEGAAATYASKIYYLSGAMFSAFVIGHELGHKMKSYAKENDKDNGDPFKVGLNNEQLRASCFSELAAP